MKSPNYIPHPLDRKVESDEILTEEGMEKIRKEYQEILAMHTLEESVNAMINKVNEDLKNGKDGIKYFINFNGNLLFSDKIKSINDAYMEIYGVTRFEYYTAENYKELQEIQQQRLLEQANKELNK